MQVNEFNLQNHDAWDEASPKEALRQIAGLCQKVISLDLQVSSDGTFFHSASTPKDKLTPKGILSIQGRLIEGPIILVRAELIRGTKNLRLPLGSLCEYLSALSEKTRLIVPQQQTPGQLSLGVELKVNASPMSMARSSAFISELKHLDHMAGSLQTQLPVDRTDAELARCYKEFSGILKPIVAWVDDNTRLSQNFSDWAKESIDFLLGSSCLAIASPFPIMLDFALATLASVSQKEGKSFGQLMLPAIKAKGLVDLTRRAPGIVVIPAIRISLGTSPYELGNEMKALLSSLTQGNTPAIFTGSHQELQAVFHGGQGGTNDPLFPVLRHIPEVPLETLTRFTVQYSGQLQGGLPPAPEAELTARILDAIDHLTQAEQKRILPMVAQRTVNEWHSGKNIPASSATSFASKLCGLSETLAGLPSKPRVSRSADVQEHFTRVLTDPHLLPFFQEHLLAQDRALEQLVSRLRMECLTRPLHQPIRYLAQGTPATGKSESTSLLAQRLGIPYMNIDAASLSDYHTAAAQLLGSGRGIVGAHQSGRLEQAAKHHTGVVIEVSDLDHAPSAVRAALADLFLQLLETGEAQSATGAMFSCANLIFAFTMNLPGGLDEEVRKGLGFNNFPSQQEITKRVSEEIKRMLSIAFLSRVGTPILFEPLNSHALAAIIERAVRKAVFDAAERLNFSIHDVILEAGIGLRVISSLDTGIKSFGARALLEHGRSIAAQALLDLQQNNVSISDKSLFITINSEGKIYIKPL